MKKKELLIWVGILVLIVGCVTKAPETGSLQNHGKGYPLTVVDDLGRNVTILKEPERIISTAPSNTEILFALGLGDKIVGVTEYCNYPLEASEKEKIGGFSTVSIEKVISLEPDLVLASDKTGDENIKKLGDFGIAVVVLRPRDIEGVLRNIELVGRVAGVEENTSELIGDMRGRVGAVEEKRGKNKPRVFYVVWHDPLMSAGRETLIGDLIEKAGGINIANFTGYKVVSLEAVIVENPDIIITGLGHGDAKNLTYEFILNNPRLRIVNAVKNGRVYGIDADLASRFSPRAVDALEQFSGWILEVGG